MFISPASTSAHPSPKALGAQMEGPFLLCSSGGCGPTGKKGQYLVSKPETSALVIPIISEHTESNNVVFDQVTTTKDLNSQA